MKKIIQATLFVVLFASFFISCKKDEPTVPPTVENPNEYVNKWIYKKMTIYYLWSDKIPAKPDSTLAPDKFFSSLLNKYDKTTNPQGDRFSWIQESYVDLLNMLSGVSSDEIGFEYVKVNVSPEGTAVKQYYLLVLYPKLGTDAYAKGIKKGRFVTKIDGQDITDNNIKTLVGGSGSKTLTLADWKLNASNEYKLEVAAAPVTVNMHKNFAETPVYMDSTYNVNGKKVGYLVYNFFARDRGDGSFEYDKQLMKALERIKSKGATEFVLDLRYNSGGAVSSALALSSALVPNRSTSNLFTVTEFNAFLTSEFQKQEGVDFNKDYFIDKIVDVKYDEKGNEISRKDVVDVPSLNLKSMYVLVSNWTASASEMVINGLKPYMGDANVILIGKNTVGKNVGSFSLYEKNDPKNKWGMQPIVLKYYNKDKKSDFTTGFVPNYLVDEFKDTDLRLVDFGNTEDVMLNKALTLINGGTTYKPAPARVIRMNTKKPMRVIENSASILEQKFKVGLYDDIRGEAIKKMMKK